MVVLGFERLSFPDKEDPNKMVTGVQLYCGNPIDPEKGEGFAYSKKGYERLYLSEWFLTNRLGGEIPPRNSTVVPFYNREGRLQHLDIVPPTK